MGPAWVGDMVIANALFRLLAERGQGPVDVVAPPWSQPVAQRMREVRRSWLLEAGHGRLALGARLRLASTLRREGFSRAIVLPRSLKAALMPYFAGVPQRTGLRGEFRYGFVNDMRPIEWTRARPMVERLCALGLDPGESLPARLPEPRLVIDRDAQQAIARNLGIRLDRPAAALLPGAEHGPAKRWPPRYFAELSRRLSGEGLAVWLLGSPRDVELGEAISAESNGAAVNLCGRTRLVDAIDLLGAANVAVSNDSGLLHVAAAVGTPVVALYGSSSPVYTPPLTERRRILYLSLECSPCFSPECPLGHQRCLRELKPDQVFGAAMSVARTGVD